MKQKKVIPYPFHSTDNPLLSDHAKELDIFRNKPFWISDKEKHDFEFLITNGNCCFNHIISLPTKNGKEYPIFDYELDVINKIENNRNIWIKKASGIGATELILRYLTWKILFNNELEHKNIFIISGTYVHHANELKVRMENLCRKKFPLMQLESKFTDLWIKNTNIKIFPSRNVKDLRGYTDVSYLFIDEADHFEPSVTNELLHAITRYEEKSKCTTIMVSTPNKPDGLFQSIEYDHNSKYEKIILSYEVGLGKIYDPLEIEKKKLEPEFEREYNLKYLGKIGNVFTPYQIDNCIKLAEPLLWKRISPIFRDNNSCGLPDVSLAIM
jgi:Terminase large subunit, T4likevirus-type, N-terminal